MVNLKVLLEQIRELRELLLVSSLILPASLGMENIIRDTSAGLGDGQVEDRSSFILDTVSEFSRVDRIDDGARVAERNTLANSILATNPTGINKPDIDLVMMDLVSQHLGILCRMPNKERLPKASREGGSGLTNSLLGTSNLGSISTNKVVHSLSSIELAHGRKHTKRVTSQHDNVLGMPSHARNPGVRDKLDWIGTPGVLGDRAVVKVDFTGDVVNNDVLKDTAKLDCIKDLGFLVSGEINALGVTSTLNVEDSVISPAVLIITNEVSMDVSRKSCLACARQTKEKSNIIRRASLHKNA